MSNITQEAELAFSQYDFGDQIILDDSGWETICSQCFKSVFIESINDGDSQLGIFTYNADTGEVDWSLA
jgi:hypothetical protein